MIDSVEVYKDIKGVDTADAFRRVVSMVNQLVDLTADMGEKGLEGFLGEIYGLNSLVSKKAKNCRAVQVYFVEYGRRTAMADHHQLSQLGGSSFFHLI